MFIWVIIDTFKSDDVTRRREILSKLWLKSLKIGSTLL